MNYIKECFNLAHVVKLKLIKESINHCWKYIPAKKVLFFNIPERWSYVWDRNYFETPSLNSYEFIECNQVFIKDRIEITFSNNQIETLYFDTYDEALKNYEMLKNYTCYYDRN